MGFVKLDTGILNSTLWIERGQRDVFITALLMAMPKEFDCAVGQISHDSCEPTGFIVPPGWYGFVPSSGPGIVRMALVEREEGMQALRDLGEPDPESRSSAFEGRRLIRVDGGYLVLNYMRYRDRDTTAAERMKRLRDRRKNVTPNAESVTHEHGEQAEHSTDVHQNVTQTEADTDTEEIKDTDANASVVRRAAQCPHAEIVALYHDCLPSLSRVRDWTSQRQAYLRKRWSEDRERQSLDWWRGFFEYVSKSDWLMGRKSGRDGEHFECDLEWLIRPRNFIKVLEGKYENRKAA